MRWGGAKGGTLGPVGGHIGQLILQTLTIHIPTGIPPIAFKREYIYIYIYIYINTVLPRGNSGEVVVRGAPPTMKIRFLRFTWGVVRRLIRTCWFQRSISQVCSIDSEQVLKKGLRICQNAPEMILRRHQNHQKIDDKMTSDWPQINCKLAWNHSKTTLYQPQINPGSTLDRPWIDPKSTLDRP